jgi:hypothetical protein
MSIRKSIENLLMAGIIGAVGIAVTYIAKMSENMQQMTIAVQILTEKLTNIDKIAQDHELRLREIEKYRKFK